MSELEMNEEEKVSIDWAAALQWGVGSAMANVFIALLLSFWLGEPVSIGAVTMTSVMLAVVGGGITGQLISVSLPYGRLKTSHWLGVAVVAAPFGFMGFLFGGEGVMGAALTYSSAVVMSGIPMGYMAMRYLAFRPVAPEGHPDNIPD